MEKRVAISERKTKETDITVKLNIDGSGEAKINSDRILRPYAGVVYFLGKI